uniref:Uncharacterized protein n=1 Tax=Oryza punctata TaxID=4537 RepID=A0A0E0KG09_ORYPU
MVSHHAHCQSVCRYVVRCIIHRRYPVGTISGICGITADTQVYQPSTCEVSSIMVGCEVSVIMVGYEVSRIMASCTCIRYHG